MPFRPLSHPPSGRPAASASWLLRLITIILGGLLLWASACSATHDSDSHAHGWTPVTSGQLPLAAEAVEREEQEGPHPHHGSACAPYAVSHLLPQANQLFTGATLLAALAVAAAGLTAAVAVQQWVLRREGGRSRIRLSGRSTLAVVCRWRI